jgi:hypothetical protein
MSDRSDEQDQAEVLDDDEIDILDYPPDGTLGVDDLLDDDVPVAGDYAPDDLRHRLAREEPDVIPAGDDAGRVTVGGLIEPDDPFGPDETKELVGEFGEPDSAVGGAVLTDSAVAGHGADTLPAEEAALHLVDDGIADAETIDLVEGLPGVTDDPEESGIVLDDDEASRH